MVKLLDLESICPGFETYFEHLMNLFHGSAELLNPSTALVKSQLVCLPPVGILSHSYVSFAIFFSVV